MKTAAEVLVALIALEHLWFFVFESFLWRTPLALKALHPPCVLALVRCRLCELAG